MKQVIIYTDGACSGNPGPGGWGAVLKYGAHERELSGGEASTTNNRMELTAVIEALRLLKEPCVVELYSDSRYVIDALEKRWVYGWKQRGWVKSDKKPALNMELARVEDEIEKLLNTLTGANAVLLSYANSKIEELDTHRQALTKEIAALSAEIMSPEQIERLSVYLNQWEEIDFEDRRQVADGLISQIRATDEHVSIEWKI